MLQLFHRDWVCLVDPETLKRKQAEWRERNRSEFGTVKERLWRQVTLRGYIEGPVLELVNVDGEVLRTGYHAGGYERKLTLTWRDIGEDSSAKLQEFLNPEVHVVAQKLLRIHADLVASREALTKVVSLNIGGAVDMTSQARAYG